MVNCGLTGPRYSADAPDDWGPFNYSRKSPDLFPPWSGGKGVL